MFSSEELQKLMNLLDLATKAGGLNVAQDALPLAAKIQQELIRRQSPKDELGVQQEEAELQELSERGLADEAPSPAEQLAVRGLHDRKR